MQLASLLDRELQARKERRTIWQKGKQVIEAWEIEKDWSKQEILEAYLNLVTFRGELPGIAAASRGLFGKNPHGLDQSESLILASLIRSPNASSSELIKRVSHFNKMMDWKIGEEEIHSNVRQIFLGQNWLRPREDLGPHIARRLLKGEPYGTTVISTLDSPTQRFALDRIVHHLLPLRMQNVAQVASSVLSPGVLIRPGAIVRESIIMTDTIIESGAIVERSVIDKRVHVEANARIGGGIADPNIVLAVIGKNSVVPSGMVIEPGGAVSTDVIQSDYDGMLVKSGDTIQTKRLPYEI